ncbi:MAG: amidohydrolase family protein [Nitrososphaerota archaeon]|nr:amidohydrolase family protein [Nitrososphaerota archaeon]
MIIDTHVHIYGRGLAEAHQKFLASRFPTLGIDLDHQIDYLMNLMKKHNVDRILAHCNPNEAVAEMIKNHKDKIIPFASIEYKDSKKAVTDIEYCIKSLGFKGIAEQAVPSKHYFIDDFDLLDPVYKKASDLGIPVTWHLQESFLFGASRSKFSGVSRVQEVCFKYPQLKILICHLGGLDNYRNTLSGLSGYKNVYFDTSGVVNSMYRRFLTPVWGSNASSRTHDYTFPEHAKNGKPKDHSVIMESVKTESAKVLREAANAVPDRIMMATDGPFASNPELEIEVCKKALGHDSELLSHVLGENARTFLNV